MTGFGDRLERVRGKLQGAAQSYGFSVKTQEVGRVQRVSDGVARISGLPTARLMEVLRIDDAVEALALDLGETHVGAVLLGHGREVRAGSLVSRTTRVASIPVGEALLGRVVDPLGRPLDHSSPVHTEVRWPLERGAPAIWEREAVTEPLLTGITLVDALFPIGRGQRQLVIGDRGTGKSTIAIDTVSNQKGQSVKCVYVCVGQMSADVQLTLNALQAADALDNTCMVVAGSDSSPGLRYIAPYAGMSIAEYFRDRGEDALVVFDDLEAHAIAYRELCLLLRRPPGREAYPGDIFFIHAKLLERATRLNKKRGGGSLTALPLCDTRSGRISDFIPTNLISITDGQLYLDEGLFDRGFKPAIDIGKSVSRVGGKTQRASMKTVAGQLRLELARFAELEVFSRFGARIDPETQQVLTRGARARELLKQAPETPVGMGEQVALLMALERGRFDGIEISRVRRIVALFLQELGHNHPELVRSLARGHGPKADDFSKIEAAFEVVRNG